LVWFAVICQTISMRVLQRFVQSQADLQQTLGRNSVTFKISSQSVRL